MQVSKKEKRFYEVFIERGHNQKALVNFILGARKCPMYGSIFHINGLCKKLKSELSKIYHGRLDFDIDGKPVRTFISETWEL